MKAFKVYCDPPSTQMTKRTNNSVIENTCLEDLNRRDIQALAKKHGVKANMKTCEIISELKSILGSRKSSKLTDLSSSQNVNPVESKSIKTKKSTKQVEKKSQDKIESVADQCKRAFEQEKLKMLRRTVTEEAVQVARVWATKRQALVMQQKQQETVDSLSESLQSVTNIDIQDTTTTDPNNTVNLSSTPQKSVYSAQQEKEQAEEIQNLLAKQENLQNRIAEIRKKRKLEEEAFRKTYNPTPESTRKQQRVLDKKLHMQRELVDLFLTREKENIPPPPGSKKYV